MAEAVANRDKSEHPVKEPQKDKEVSKEDKQFDTYPAAVEERFNRERKETIDRNKAEAEENARRNGQMTLQPVPPPEPKKETKEEKDAKQKKEDLSKKLDETLKKYNGNESSIPPSDPYWSELAELRALNNP